MPDKNLYYIAIVAPEPILSEVKALKHEMREHFNAKHALKSPAHITLQMPFKLTKNQEHELKAALEYFAKDQKCFEVKLLGFDCFAPRVVFVKVAEHEKFLRLHAAFKQFIKNKDLIPTENISQDMHPHMTIATRDLKKDVFPQAWDYFKDKPYEASFLADRISLLKHNGKFWEVHKEFDFILD